MSAPTVQDFFDLSGEAYDIQPDDSIGSGVTDPQYTQDSDTNIEGVDNAVLTNNSDNGPTYATFINGNNIIISFRGSSTIQDWKVSDAEVLAGNSPAVLGEALTDVQQIENAYQTEYPGQTFNFYVTGHSLGGIEAEYVAANLGIGGAGFETTGVGKFTSFNTNATAQFTNYIISNDPVVQDSLADGSYYGSIVTLPTQYYLSSALAASVIEAFADINGQPILGYFLGEFVSGFVEHSLYSVGRALLQQGLINNNTQAPFEPGYLFGDFTLPSDQSSPPSTSFIPSTYNNSLFSSAASPSNEYVLEDPSLAASSYGDELTGSADGLGSLIETLSPDTATLSIQGNINYEATIFAGNNQSVIATQATEILVNIGTLNTLIAGGTLDELIDLSGTNSEFNSQDFQSVTEIALNGTSGTDNTFSFSSGTNVLIGDMGNNTFVMAPSLTSGVDIIWGGGGTSTYDIYGDVDILYTDGTPTPQQIESLTSDISGFEAAASGNENPASGYYPGSYSPITFLIDPTANDYITGLSGNYTIGIYSPNAEITFPFFERSFSSDGADGLGPIFNAEITDFLPVDGSVELYPTVLQEEGSSDGFSADPDSYNQDIPNNTPAIQFYNFVNDNLNITFGGVLDGIEASNYANFVYAPSGAFEYNQSSFIDLGSGSASSSTGGSTTNGANLVPSGGVSFDEGVSSAGTQYILSGGSAVATSVGAGGTETVLTGGVESAAQFYDGGVGIVASGGATYIPTISSGGKQYVDFGGEADLTLVQGLNASQILGGAAYSTTIVSGGNQTILSGGISYDLSVGNGGVDKVDSGGTVQSGTILSGGIQYLYSGGDAYSLIVEGGGTEVLSGGTLYSATVEAGGLVLVSSGGQTYDSLILNGGAEVVYSGGLTSASNVNGGLLVVIGTGISDDVGAGGELLVTGQDIVITPDEIFAYDSSTSNVVVGAGESEYVMAGAIAQSTKVIGGGVQSVMTDGIAANNIVGPGGSQIVSSGATASSIVISGGLETVLPGGFTTGTVLSASGNQILLSGAVASGTIIEAEGTAQIDGGSDYNSIVEAGGQEIVFTNGRAISSTVTNAGVQIVSSGGLARHPVVDSGGELVVSSGGSALNASIEPGGSALLLPGALGSVIDIFGGEATLDAGVNTVTMESDAAATVNAAGAASVSVSFDDSVAGSHLDFVNNSSAAATVYVGSYGNVTAFGGAGGGFFVGGAGGNNSLVGGTGAVTLEGGGAGDYLQAGSAAQNYLFAGSGDETLTAGSNTKANVFQFGSLSYGLISTAGSGLQSMIIGSTSMAGASTVIGSAASGAFNVFDFVGDATAGGGSFTITDFSSVNSVIYLVNAAASGAGDATISSITSVPGNSGSSLISLSDGTRITLTGVSASAVQTVTGSNGLISIT